MTDPLTENARLRAALEFYANPDAWNQPPVRTREGLVSIEYENEASKMQRDRGKIARTILATPATDAAQEAARVPEIAALIEAASALGVRDMVAGWNGEGREHPYTPHPASLWAKINTTCGAVYALDAALRAIAGDRT